MIVEGIRKKPPADFINKSREKDFRQKQIVLIVKLAYSAVGFLCKSNEHIIVISSVLQIKLLNDIIKPTDKCIGSQMAKFEIKRGISIINAVF